MLDKKGKQTSLLITHADMVITVNQDFDILTNISIYIEGNKIKEMPSKRKTADKIINARGKIVLPGFINTHHHTFQAFLRHLPELQNQRIDNWIKTVCDLTQKMDPEAHYYAALTNMAELLLSGCTTTTDMLYIYPNQYSDMELFEAGVQAASELGMRLHSFRGSMSLSQKDGALFPDKMVESSSKIEERTRQVIQKYHQSDSDAILKVGIAPCTVFTSSTEDYQTAANLSRELKVNIQTHLSESAYETQYCADKYHKRPLKYLEDLGWDNDQTSFAHGIEFDNSDISLLSKHHQNVCHCPISNARQPIGQKGLAPIWELLEANVNVAIGVDGSAGNDSSNILEELRWARTLQGARKTATYLTPESVFKIGTRNGAQCLGWGNMIGSLEVGKCADLAIFDTSKSISHVGNWNRVGSLLSCQALTADTIIINGKVVVEESQIVNIEQKMIVEKSWQKWKQIF